MHDNTAGTPPQRPPAPPYGRRWTRWVRRDDPGAATRWFGGSEPPAVPNGRDPYRVTTIVVPEDDDGCLAGVYLYWRGKRGMTEPVTADEPEEMVGPVRFDGEHVLEELWRQHPDADKYEHDVVFEGVVEKMLSDHLIDMCGKLSRDAQESAMRNSERWIHKVEDAAEKTRSWRLAHG